MLMGMSLEDFAKLQKRAPVIQPPITRRPMDADGQILSVIVDMNRVDFFLSFVPPTITSQQKGERVVVPRNGKPFVHHFVKPEVEAMQAELRRMLFPHIPKEPLKGPLRMICEWLYPWRESETKKGRAAGWRWHDKRPDYGNIQKALDDQMQALGFFEDDGQICDARVMKKWSDTPGIRITIYQLGISEL